MTPETQYTLSSIEQEIDKRLHPQHVTLQEAVEIVSELISSLEQRKERYLDSGFSNSGVIEEKEEKEEKSDNAPIGDLLPTIQSRLKQRAKDLSLSIIKPETFARKLREELISIAGPQAAITYHISAQFDSSTNRLNFQIARLSPKTAIKLQSSLNVTTVQLAYTYVTQSGWRVSVGLNAAYTGTAEQRNRFQLPKEAETKIEFGVTLSK